MDKIFSHGMDIFNYFPCWQITLEKLHIKKPKTKKTKNNTKQFSLIATILIPVRRKFSPPTNGNRRLSGNIDNPVEVEWELKEHLVTFSKGDQKTTHLA